MEKNKKVDLLLSTVDKWSDEFWEIRKIVLEFDIVEDIKWGWPCYILDGKNLFLIHGFKDYCAIMFMKGCLIEDKYNILIKQTKDVIDRRQMRFSSIDDIQTQKDIIREYIKKSIEIEKSGKKIDYSKNKEIEIIDELKIKFEKNIEFKKAFFNLTKGKQKGYSLFWGSAKQSTTRTKRIEKYIDHIIEGRGIYD